MRVRMKVIEDHFDDDDDDDDDDYDENHGDEERRKTTKKQSRSDMKTFHAESQQENPKFVVQNPRSKIHIQNAKRAQDQTSTPLNFRKSCKSRISSIPAMSFFWSIAANFAALAQTLQPLPKSWGS